MKKNEECKIVQDLLPSYVDKVTNDVTNKLVERHLLECNECKKILEDMGEEIILDKMNEKKEIDYLKKIKTKNRIKTFLMVLIAIVISFYTIKYALFSNYFITYGDNGKIDYAQTLWNLIANPKIKPFEDTQISHIIVTYQSEYPEYPGERIKDIMIYSFDTEKGVCIGTRWCIEGTPVKEHREEFERNFVLTDYQSMTDIEIEGERLICNLNIWNGTPTQEVKNMIYENYDSATIIEF